MGHLAYKRLIGRYDRELFLWLLSLQPGDVIGACTCMNHVVQTIEVMRQPRRNGWFVDEIRVTDADGRWHWAPGGGCVCRPYTREKVLESVAWSAREMQFSEEQRSFDQAILDAEASGKPFIDARGVYVGPPRAVT
jgi:hypothetical protein